jgi:hypothetical protein
VINTAKHKGDPDDALRRMAANDTLSQAQAARDTDVCPVRLHRHIKVLLCCWAAGLLCYRTVLLCCCATVLCCCAAVLLCCCAAVLPYCAALLLCCCAAVLLCCCATVLCCYAAVLLCCCAAVLLCCCAAVLLCCFAAVLPYCAAVLLCRRKQKFNGVLANFVVTYEDGETGWHHLSAETYGADPNARAYAWCILPVLRLT